MCIRDREISLADLATALAVALGAVAISVAIADAVRAIPGAPELVRQTLGQKDLVRPLVMAGLATVFPARLAAIRGAHELGTLVMYLFFVVVGVPASAAALAQRGEECRARIVERGVFGLGELWTDGQPPLRGEIDRVRPVIGFVGCFAQRRAQAVLQAKGKVRQQDEQQQPAPSVSITA